jgi:hypothetical protein
MKIKLFLLLMMSFFWGFVCEAQTELPKKKYEKFTFKNISPEWYEVCYDDLAQNGTTTDGYNNFLKILGLEPLIVGDKIYQGFHSSLTAAKNCYIQCRSLSTGQLFWQTRYSYDDADTQEIARLLRMNQDGNLEVFGLKRIHPNLPTDGGIYSLDNILTHRVYNSQNGDLISLFHRDLDDPDAFQMQHAFNKWHDFSYIFYEDTYLQILEKPRNLGLSLKSSKIDFSGKLIEEPIIKEQPYIARFFNITRISKDTLLAIGYDYKSLSLYFRYMKSNLEVIEDIIYPTDSTGFWNFELLDISKDKSKFLMSNQLSTTGSFPWPYLELYVFDRKGKVLKKASLPEKELAIFVLEWEEDNDFFVYSDYIASKRLEGGIKTSLDIIEVSETSSEVLKSITSVDSLKIINFTSKLDFDDKRLVISFEESAYYHTFGTSYKWDDNARAQGMMLINKQDLGLLPSDVDDGDFSDATILFPNPVTESLMIRFAAPYKGLISISNISGRTVMVRDVTDLSEEVNIDMSYLVSGMYIVRLPEHVSGRSYKVVKM